MGSTTPAPPRRLSNDVLLLVVPFPQDEQWAPGLKARYPGLEVRCVVQQVKLPPDPIPKEAFDRVTMLCSLFPQPPELLQNVRFVQLVSAGADRWAKNELYTTRLDVPFCTTNGAHA